MKKKLCDTCIYRNNVEQLKPCIIYRDDCEFYEKARCNMKKFRNRKEQREVTETMNALLLPILDYLNADTAIKVRRALYLLGEIEVEPQESEVSDADSD